MNEPCWKCGARPDDEIPGSADVRYGCKECGIELFRGRPDWMKHERKIHGRDRRKFA